MPYFLEIFLNVIRVCIIDGLFPSGLSPDAIDHVSATMCSHTLLYGTAYW